jgi:ribosomal protein L29
MKKKELNELRNKEVTDLMKLVGDKKSELVRFLAGMKVSQDKNIKKGRNLRDEIAKIATIIREKQLFEQNSKKVA